MRIAVFSDMHGNCVALDAVLDDMRGADIDQLVCLGDAVQGGPQPAEVVARLRDLACPVVMGNADAWLLTGEASDAEAIDAERQRKMDAVREWSLSRLSVDDLAFIASFQTTVELPLQGELTLLGFHGSPHSFDDVITPATPDVEVGRLLGGFEPRILAGGHTHVQQIRHLHRSFYFGCGSAGFAYRHDQPDNRFHADPWAEYAILSARDGKIALEFRRVPFDVDRLIAVYRESGRPFVDEEINQYR